MAELTVSRSKQQMTASAFAGIFGLFAGLCATFAAFATLSDWHDEATQARWPVVPAIVERADVVATARAAKDGGGTVWKLRTRVHYELSGEGQTATLTSHSVFSEAEAARLQSWAAQHRKGSHIDIRYDPSRQNQAAFASADLSGATGRIRNDFVLLLIAVLASAGLLTLAKYLRAREARAAPAADNASGGLALGIAVSAMGLMLTGFVISAGVHASPFAADNFMGAPAGLMFVFAGVLLALPPQYAKWRNLLATLLITCFALTLDWVAFGPGERRFGGSIMGIGFIPGELMGRAVFGLFAVILDIWAIAMWIGQCRRAFGVSANPDASIEQDRRTTSPPQSTA